MSALAFDIGAANKYFKNTSIPVRTNLYTVDVSGPTMSICIMSPEKRIVERRLVEVVVFGVCSKHS